MELRPIGTEFDHTFPDLSVMRYRIMAHVVCVQRIGGPKTLMEQLRAIAYTPPPLFVQPLLSNVQTEGADVVSGFLASDSCHFCGEHDTPKAYPYVCQDCFDAALELARAMGWQPKTITMSTAGLTKLSVEYPPGQLVEAALLRVAHGETTQDDASLLRAAIQCQCDDDCPLLEGWGWDETG